MQIEDEQPWYKQFWPWALMVMPATAVVAGLYTYSLAASTSSGLVVDDYYKEGKAINRSLERGKHARELGLSAAMSVHGNAVRLVLGNPRIQGEQQLQLKFSHATIPGRDQTIAVHKAEAGVWTGQIQTLAAGKWFVDLLPLDNSWRLAGSMDNAAVSELGLEPAL